MFQEGSKRVVTINQNDYSKGNQAITDQANYGSGQTITIDQNTYSNNNKARVEQAGDGNKTSVSQTYNSIDNSAEVVQGRSTKFGGLNPNSFNATATVKRVVIRPPSTKPATATSLVGRARWGAITAP